MVIVLGDPYDTDSKKDIQAQFQHLELRNQFHQQKQYWELRIPEKAKWK